MAHKAEHETEKGTGKHPHKDSEEPYPHTKGSEGKQASHQGSSGSHESHSSGRGQSGSDGRSSSGEKSREYTDKDGNIHHHTHTYQEQHGHKS